jgi:predicted DNA-binding transcriptional regulator AlpA
MTDTTDRIVSSADAAKRLGLSVRTLDRLAQTDGGLRKIQLSARRVGYRESDISGFIERGGQSTAA